MAKRPRIGFTVVLVLLSFAARAPALSLAVKCEASKLKSAGKYGACRLKAAAKAVKTGGTPDFTKCDEIFTLKWGQAETTAGPGICPSEGDAASLRAFVTRHTDDVSAALAGGSLPNCAGDLATCNANLGTCNTNLSTCDTNLNTCDANLSTCDTNLSTCDTNLSTCNGSLTSCLNGTCGNGVIDAGDQCDQNNLNGESCVTRGFAGGTLTCGAGCAFDTSGCWPTRFVDNADGTITDRQTGLMWEKKTEWDFGSNFANLHDADNTYLWAGKCSANFGKFCQPTSAAAALCAARAEGGTAGCAECTGGDGVCVNPYTFAPSPDTIWTWTGAVNAANFAGHSDWRVPTLTELLGIIDFLDGTAPSVDVAFDGPGCGASCTDITDPACSCTYLNVHWSATTYAINPNSAWFVDFVAGSSSAYLRHEYEGVRAVRGGP